MPNRKEYRRVRITPSISDLDCAFQTLMDILRKPSLGHYVRHIEYRQTKSRYRLYDVKPYEPKPDEEDMRLLRSATRRAGFTEALQERVLNMLLRKSVVGDRLYGFFSWDEVSNTRAPATYVTQALTALLVSVSPKLESMAMMPTFYIDINEEEDDSFVPSECDLDLLLRETNKDSLGKPYLENLRRVYMTNLGDDHFDDGEVYVAMDFIGCLAMLRNLPSLEWIRTDVLAEDDNVKPSLEPKSSNGVGQQYTRDINPRTFILSVLEHKSTLEKLDLDAEAHITDFNFRDPGDFEFDGEDARAEAQAYWAEPPPDSFWDQRGSLKDFEALKRLSIGVNLLLYFAAGVNNEDENKSVSLVKYLPPNLEYLCIKGYEKGRRKHNDAQIDALKALVESGSTSLKEIYGVDELIPNAEDIEFPNNYPDLLWKLSNGWSDEEEYRHEE
ncbi:uncharacterized protein NFIA_094930 [Aspergillus fischeri NRRL 181]|uniref:F-box domain protein n=1 Tax=Neosartorya fischeri (strain ATCC 1020 / DSM 3700 / CBS 544.65 / FGSC A1164 / JCM 1740 / NRRL 181 / WB 181) TaxID=331117 RepID=A1DAI3_NEOFI|nr:uncharacterized protein NFIA_094930 [Aspergillus fischeri NRRL 181]EAW19873.1 hypothetical protein NFIA_094930 [Aspergillus fischeri NRRL 181]